MEKFDKLRNLDLEAAVNELRDAVEAEMKRLTGRGPVVRDVALVRVLREHPELGAAIERASDSDELYKVAASASGPSLVRQGVEAMVQKEADALRLANPALSEGEARAQVWLKRRDLFDTYHQPGAELPGVASVAAIAKRGTKLTLDAAVRELSATLAPGDPVLGMQLVSKRFPRLVARWRGAA